MWLSGLWCLPVGVALWLLLPESRLTTLLVITACLAIAPVPALLRQRRHCRRLAARVTEAEGEAESLRMQFATISHRVGRLREELSAANQQARLSHQLTLLGQFTAGFLHEYNNPLAIVTNRIEVLLDERKQDGALCTDLEQMLAETRYMSKIAQTLFRALRHERGAEAFEPCAPAELLQEAAKAIGPGADAASVSIIVEVAEAPRVDVPNHSISEVVRGLIANSITALKGREDGLIWLRLEPYRTPGAKVVIRVEDNGPGVPESIRDHLFEPFASNSPGREHLGLGLFLAASLVDTYDGTLRYEARNGGGSSFVIEMPAARFTRDQPFHWFIKGGPE